MDFRIVVVIVLILLVGALAFSRSRRSRSGRDTNTYRVTTEAPELVDPRDLLFLLPTINDGVPAVEPVSSAHRPGEPLVLHEDDWRQEEFLLSANQTFVDETFAQLRSHAAIHRVGIGFREVFVRSEPAHHFRTEGLKVQKIQHQLGARSPVDLHLLGGASPMRVLGGFAFRVNDAGFLYGQELDGKVVALGLRVTAGPGRLAHGSALHERSGDADFDGVARLARTHGLLFVDWLRHDVIAPGDAAGLAAWAQRAIADLDAAT